MPKYVYTVANQEGKKLSGTVVAPDEEAARKELNNLGFSVLAIKEAPTEAAAETKTKGKKFIFEAIDKNSKLVTGTIVSEDVQKAFSKLMTEYSLTVTAIWVDGSKPEQIEEARKKGTVMLQETLKKEMEIEVEKSEDTQEKEKRELLKKTIDSIITKVNDLLQNYEAHIDADQKTEIDKRIDKLLRIKHSTNLDYILKTAEDLLMFIESQEKSFQEKGLQEQRIQLKMKTKGLLKELNKTAAPKADSITEDIVTRIETWQKTHPKEKIKGFSLILYRFLNRIKNVLKTPPEIKVIKEEIKTINGQIIEFIKLYFKEPTPEYKQKVKNSIKSLWGKRKQAKEHLKKVKEDIRNSKIIEEGEDDRILFALIKEINTLTGWLLAFYIIYYFVSLYLNTKDFGFANMPNFLTVYESQFFKYILVIIFMLHGCTALKVNFFKRSILASIFLPVVFVVTSIITLLNF
ncbi:hypothetical protein ACFL21_00430 [Patescibacteria group bacterium]